MGRFAVHPHADVLDSSCRSTCSRQKTPKMTWTRCEDARYALIAVAIISMMPFPSEMTDVYKESGGVAVTAMLRASLSPRHPVKNHRRMQRVSRIDRLLAAALVLGIVLVSGGDAGAQDPPPAVVPPKTTTPPPPPSPPIYKLQPLNTLPGQPGSQTQVDGQTPAGQAADGAAQPFIPRASASTSAVSQRAFSSNFIGDGFGPQPFAVTFQAFAVTFQALGANMIQVTSPGAGGNVGTSKIVENASPIPRDRVYFNYSGFNGVPLTENGVNVSRYTPGFEKTFFDGMASIEVRTPFATTLSNNVYAVDSNNINSTQFGDLTIYLKQLLYQSDTLAVSAGLGLELPTASNTNVFLGPNIPLLTIKNQSVHLLPFLGSVYSPTSQLFVQQFLQFDVDTNGNAVSIADINGGGGLQSAGRINDMTYLYYSVGAGYWLFDNPDSDRLFTRIAPMVEIHYNKSLTSTDTLSSNGIGLGTSVNQDLLNGTMGMTAMMGPNKSLTLAYCTPLSSIDHRQFNGEFRLMFNWFFGGSVNRFNRVQF